MKNRSRVILKSQQENESSTSFQTSPSPSACTPLKSTSPLFVPPSGLLHVVVPVTRYTRLQCPGQVRTLVIEEDS